EIEHADLDGGSGGREVDDVNDAAGGQGVDDVADGHDADGADRADLDGTDELERVRRAREVGEAVEAMVVGGVPDGAEGPDLADRPGERVRRRKGRRAAFGRGKDLYIDAAADHGPAGTDRHGGDDGSAGVADGCRVALTGRDGDKGGMDNHGD